MNIYINHEKILSIPDSNLSENDTNTDSSMLGTGMLKKSTI